MISVCLGKRVSLVFINGRALVRGKLGPGQHSRKKAGSWIQVVFRPKLGKLRQDLESWRRLGKLRQIGKVHPKD